MEGHKKIRLLIFWVIPYTIILKIQWLTQNRDWCRDFSHVMDFPWKLMNHQMFCDWKCYLCLFVTATRTNLRRIYCAVNLMKAILQMEQFLISLILRWLNIISAKEERQHVYTWSPNNTRESGRHGNLLSKICTISFEQSLQGPLTWTSY
jgi:hypothetical protein